ncbi:hypothetical protein HX079_18565, partial [Myroides odoratimimus]|nr:hypothetical protein [Myroides odoratimimus]
ELAGPKLSTSSQGGYTPIYYEVPKGGEGIYRVEFTSRNNIGHGPVKYANDNWKQSSDAAIAAWDVSVINGEKIVDGRVFTTNLNFTNGNFNRNETDAGWDYQHVSFQGEFFVRTNDGFTYKVTHKGSSGIVWAFFVNNNGFFDYYTKNSLYKSMNSEARRVIYNIHNPNTPDNDSNITHKIY